MKQHAHTNSCALLSSYEQEAGKTHNILWLPRVFPQTDAIVLPLFKIVHWANDVMLSAVVISLLPAAVGLPTDVKIMFGGTLTESSKKTRNPARWGTVLNNSWLWGLFIFFTLLLCMQRAWKGNNRVWWETFWGDYWFPQDFFCFWRIKKINSIITPGNIFNLVRLQICMCQYFIMQIQLHYSTCANILHIAR